MLKRIVCLLLIAVVLLIGMGGCTPSNAFSCQYVPEFNPMYICGAYTYEREGSVDKVFWDRNIIIDKPVDDSQDSLVFYWLKDNGAREQLRIPNVNVEYYPTEENPHIQYGFLATQYWICKRGHENYTWKQVYYRIYIPDKYMP